MPLLTLRNIRVRYLDTTLFEDLSWQIENGEQWAIVGKSGSGKTTLLNTITGKYNVINGAIEHHYYNAYRDSHDIKDPYFNYRHLQATVGQQHDFKNRSNTTEFYYQQRFNSADADEAISVREYLFGEPGDVLPSILALIEPLNLEPLLPKALIKLSNGETRRTLLAKALLKQPKLLLLDNPFVGLDVKARQHLHGIINHVIESGTAVILATMPGEIPSGITHVLQLDQNRVVNKFTRQEFVSQQRVKAPGQSFELQPAEIALLRQLAAAAPSYNFQQIVHMEKVKVKYGESTILENLDWTILPEEKWALLGPNGAGKSTLLSLINGDNPQAYANNIILFDRKRGSGESIWDIKKKIGFVSPELHQYFPNNSSCLQVVASGYFDTIGVHHKVNAEQLGNALKWMQLLGIQYFAEKSFKFCPGSIQRLTLLARALVKQPPLLIFDEPCQGLDQEQKEHFKQVIDMLCKYIPMTLIFVTHYSDEIPTAVDKLLELKKLA
ncbi:ATP-binding cassette domain-containing protein [Chitinophaga caeni]|uniref:ATP-binding cassette domain-containing protein n=1 Tax=Chitinophaga caeni TaxID=2029983 RepID=UPI001E61FDD8|nr:ATP-binding cassette domain-containing protein [Chitinophaga caeni]